MYKETKWTSHSTAQMDDIASIDGGELSIPTSKLKDRVESCSNTPQISLLQRGPLRVKGMDSY
ncbi:hypothetical protein T265_07751 [Opisthorchis viverrini]|uniref:Uncharacterized protein n=1 Tax=Opisthorchis viverrini TaxID=6198 RepID=A0A074ZG99_OPIVI|nr:hypothetical protein T265_07751 [Opisthorchis viverrini]KER24657.1 hypothetical protein T265_07751 [Opisthorchis viverrini]